MPQSQTAVSGAQPSGQRRAQGWELSLRGLWGQFGGGEGGGSGRKSNKGRSIEAHVCLALSEVSAVDEENQASRW